MEFDRPTPSSPETPTEDKETKKNKRKKRTGFAAPIPVETSEKTSAEKPKPSSLDEALANLAIKKQEAAEEKAVKQNDEPESDSAADTVPETEATNIETDAAEDSAEGEERPEPYEETEKQELQPNEFSGGEVIIHLQGSEPVTERIVPLRKPGPEEQAQAKEAIPSVPEPELEPRLTEQPVPMAVEVPLGARHTEDGERPATGHAEQPSVVAVEVQPQQSGVPLEVLQPSPEDVYQQSTAEQTFAPLAAGAERPATKQEVEDALYYAEKSGQNRGLLTGLFVAGAYEHFKHKRREKRQERRFKKQSKQFDQTRKDQHFYFTEQTKQQVNTEQRFAAAEKRFENHAHPEKHVPAAVPEAPKLETPEHLTIPAGHRLETSAWHSIEVDAKTGKPVEKPVFEYGPEYYHERLQEAGPPEPHPDTPIVPPFTTGQPSQTDIVHAAPGASIPDATTQGSPIKSSLKSGMQLLGRSDATTGPLWPWLVALVVVIVCLVLVLR